MMSVKAAGSNPDSAGSAIMTAYIAVGGLPDSPSLLLKETLCSIAS